MSASPIPGAARTFGMVIRKFVGNGRYSQLRCVRARLRPALECAHARPAASPSRRRRPNALAVGADLLERASGLEPFSSPWADDRRPHQARHRRLRQQASSGVVRPRRRLRRGLRRNIGRRAARGRSGGRCWKAADPSLTTAQLQTALLRPARWTSADRGRGQQLRRQASPGFRCRSRHTVGNGPLLRVRPRGGWEPEPGGTSAVDGSGAVDLTQDVSRPVRREQPGVGSPDGSESAHRV